MWDLENRLDVCLLAPWCHFKQWPFCHNTKVMHLCYPLILLVSVITVDLIVLFPWLTEYFGIWLAVFIFNRNPSNFIFQVNNQPSKVTSNVLDHLSGKTFIHVPPWILIPWLHLGPYVSAHNWRLQLQCIYSDHRLLDLCFFHSFMSLHRFLNLQESSRVWVHPLSPSLLNYFMVLLLTIL